jgi:hypothetical protein
MVISLQKRDFVTQVSSNGRSGSALEVCMGKDLAWDHIKCGDFLFVFLQFLGLRNVETWVMKTCKQRLPVPA